MDLWLSLSLVWYKQFVDKSFIRSKSTSSCCCFFTLRGQGFRNWFQTPKLLLLKCWYSRRKGHGHKRYLCLWGFKIASCIPSVLYFLPPGFTLDWAPSFWLHHRIYYSPQFFFSTFEHANSHEIQWYWSAQPCSGSLCYFRQSSHYDLP